MKTLKTAGEDPDDLSIVSMTVSAASLVVACGGVCYNYRKANQYEAPNDEDTVTIPPSTWRFALLV